MPENKVPQKRCMGLTGDIMDIDANCNTYNSCVIIYNIIHNLYVIFCDKSNKLHKELEGRTGRNRRNRQSSWSFWPFLQKRLVNLAETK